MADLPVKLHDFIRAAEHGDDSIAGYLEPGARASADPHRFVHWRSSNAMLPAFVNCLEDGGDMRRVYTNHERAPWARPRGPGVKRRDNLRAESGDGALMVEPVPMESRRWPARVSVPAGPAPLSGGLHAAALSSAPTRSLHLYVLATRTLIASSAASGFAGVHDHVGALLVSDAGAILAAGINTGSYRHAEVSLLLSWFRDNPEAHALPAKSIVISTLTPCRQCTRYLSLAKAPDTLVRFDEADAGRSGRVGERIAERVDVDVDSRLGAALDSGVDPEFAPGLGSAPDASAAREAERRAIRNGGAGGRSRVDRAREARRVILHAARSAALVPGRAGSAGEADREAGADEREAEAAVPAYLAEWILGAAIIA